MGKFNFNKNTKDKDIVNLLDSVKSELNSQKHMGSSEKDILDLAIGVLKTSSKVKSTSVENKIATGVLDIIKTFLNI